MPGKVAKSEPSATVGLFDDWRKEIGVNRDEIASFNFDTHGAKNRRNPVRPLQRQAQVENLTGFPQPCATPR
jgi:hypothetical protein